MRILALILALVLGGGPALAADGRKYAVLSLIGDVMLISEWVPTTGARVDPNQKQFVPISEGIFDKAALLAANGVLKKLDPAANPVLLFARERSLYEAQNRMLDAGGNSVQLLDLVRGMLGGSGATHLILLTKMRSQARMQLPDATVGSGMLEGVGFYIDSSIETRLPDTRESGKGLLAPFAYFRIELIDLARGQAVAEQRVVASLPTTSPARSAAHAWGALSGAQKVRAIQELVVEETTRAVPKLIEAAP